MRSMENPSSILWGKRVTHSILAPSRWAGLALAP